MTIAIQIAPEVHVELARQATSQGLTIEVYAASLLENAANFSKAANLVDLFKPIRGLLTDEEVDTLFRRNPSTGRPADFE